MSLASLALLLLVSAPASTWPSVSAPAAPFSSGAHDAAVIAGVSHPFVLPEVKGASDNATDWYLWLTQARGVPVDRVQLLRDGQVTRERLLAAVAEARGRVEPDGTLWIVFIGHGAPAPGGEDGLLLGVDVQRSESSLRERGVPQAELLAAAAGPQAQTVAIFDACFSGRASDGVTPLVEGSQATVPVRRPALPPGLLVLSSSEEVAGPLPGHDRPAFSYLLLGALRGWADADRDQRVTADEAYRYAQRALVASVRDKNQVPSMRGGAATFVMAERAGEPSPDLARLVASAGPVSPNAPSAAAVVGTTNAPAAPSAVQLRLAEQHFARREIRLNSDHQWVRADLPTPLSRRDLVVAGGEGAPEAVKALEDAASREALYPLVWTLPPVIGLAVGTGAGIAGGFVYNAFNSDAANNAERAPFLGGFLGGFLGAGAGALLVSMPLSLSVQLDDDDRARLKNAEAELANAANASARHELGLPAR